MPCAVARSLGRHGLSVQIVRRENAASVRAYARYLQHMLTLYRVWVFVAIVL